MTLPEFIESELATPPHPGACCRLADRWIANVTGHSALARFGRDYQTDDDVGAWLAEPGGIIVAVASVMRACGWRRRRPARPGDVGLIIQHRRLAMAVRIDGGWFSRDDRGFIAAPVVAGWRAWGP